MRFVSAILVIVKYLLIVGLGVVVTRRVLLVTQAAVMNHLVGAGAVKLTGCAVIVLGFFRLWIGAAAFAEVAEEA